MSDATGTAAGEVAAPGATGEAEGTAEFSVTGEVGAAADVSAADATVAFNTLGCKLNQYESDAIASQFSRAGYRIVPFDQQADVYIINSCTVTNKADRKTRNILNRALRAAHPGSALRAAHPADTPISASRNAHPGSALRAAHPADT
ncbi:MAG: hypothetical protein ACR2PY_04500, partial [Salinispira sp.]